MIKVKNLTKIFQIPHEKKKTLYHNLTSWVTKSYVYDELYALRNVSFEVQQGEFVGIIGRNGCGKSTLLKILAGIYQPTSGNVIITDEVFPLLELGVGFQPDFTVRDNVYIYGSLLGLKRKGMKKKLDEILEFSELVRFVDTKLDKLSTGMKVRLGFAIAMQVDVPILLIDEVLAVGDQLFQIKCRDKFKEYKRSSKTILFVSHDMGAIQEYCDRVMVLNDGVIINEGSPGGMIQFYQNQVLMIPHHNPA